MEWQIAILLSVIDLIHRYRVLFNINGNLIKWMSSPKYGGRIFDRTLLPDSKTFLNKGWLLDFTILIIPLKGKKPFFFLLSHSRFGSWCSLTSLIFRYIAIPWLQAELDKFVSRFNNSPRRANWRKILPQGVPNLINSKPHLFGAKDFRVCSRCTHSSTITGSTNNW